MELDAGECAQVEVEALEADAEDGRQREEARALERGLLACTRLTVVGVVAVEGLGLEKGGERLE